MGITGSKKTNVNQTTNVYDNRTQDNKITAQDSNITATSGGDLTTYDYAADVKSSFGFASDFARSVLGSLDNVAGDSMSALSRVGDSIASLAAGNAGANAGALETVAALKQGDSIQTNKTVIIAVAVGAAVPLLITFMKK